MGRFFNERVENRTNGSKRLGLIVAAILIIIIIFIIVIAYNKNKKAQRSVFTLADLVYIEINSKMPEQNDYFQSMENVKNVTIDDSGVNITKIGKYSVRLNIDGTEQIVPVEVIDTTAPELTLKELSIKPGEEYVIDDFIEECTDNSNDECVISYSDDDDYDLYTEPGEYIIKIYAEDSNENKTVVYETLLIIEGEGNADPENPDENEDPVVPTNCEFGSNDYDKEKYTHAVVIVTDKKNNCAADAKEADTDKYRSQAEKILNEQEELIKLDMQDYMQENYSTGRLNIDKSLILVYNKNKENNAFVGYMIHIKVYAGPQEAFTTSKKNEFKDSKEYYDYINGFLALDYYVDADGTREYITNVPNIK